MRLDDLEDSSNVEDRRGASPRGRAVAGGGIGVVIIALIVMFLGGDPRQILDGAGAIQAQQQRQQQPQESGAESGINDESKNLISRVLKETENVWTEIFANSGRTYPKPKLVIFSDLVDTGCGRADSGVGPFYCPADNQIYIDPTFYNTMQNQLGAGGDFAQAYVIAHEVGHHIQNVLGTSGKVDRLRRQVSEREGNQLSVRLELQADYYAGVWAHHAKNLRIDRQDIEEAMNAASQIGDDKLQKRGQGYVNPETFTHGSSEQRVRWFMKGYQSGTLEGGDTFKTRTL